MVVRAALLPAETLRGGRTFMRISAGSLLELALRGTSLHGGKAWAALLFVLAAGELPGATLPFRRGDSNDDGKLNLSDAVFTLEYLFQGGKEPTCQDAADSNDDGFLNLSDPVHLLSFLFLGRPPPPPPGLDCGEDTTGDDLTCFCFHSCQGPPEPPPGGGDQGKYLATGEMNQPRYLHEAILTKSGLAAVFGGSDEHGFSGIDTAELYDPVSGLWIDTDFQGNRIRSGIGPRMLFTADLLPDGTVLCAGGAPDLLGSLPWEMAEIFDPELRQFDPVPVKMSKPRFRHTSAKLCDGSILLTGGQVQASVTIIARCVEPCAQIQVTVFPSTPQSEVYSPSSKTFTVLTIPDTDNPSRLQTPRGRAGHTMGRLAGPDNRLETCDDMFLVAGGFQTLTGQFAPTHKLPGVVGAGQADGL